jgi:glycosyltransferase involved in cell wall biosynthesis
MSHPIIRNDTSGWQEQIIDGENGFKFSTLALDELTECIRRVLSKNTSNSELLAMGNSSRKIATTFSGADYYQQIYHAKI